jgi:hypothetical protein
MELKKCCQETLIKGNVNPKACQATQEQEICEKIKNMKTAQFEDNLLGDGRHPNLKTTSLKTKMTSPAPRKKTSKTTKLGQNSPLVPSVARKLGLSVVPRTRKAIDHLQRTHLPSAQTEASKVKSKPVMISSSAGAKPLNSTPVLRAGPPMGGEEGTVERALGGRLANQSRGLET